MDVVKSLEYGSSIRQSVIEPAKMDEPAALTIQVIIYLFVNRQQRTSYDNEFLYFSGGVRVQ